MRTSTTVPTCSTTTTRSRRRGAAPESEELAEDEEPQDWEEPDAEADEDLVAEAPEDPGADRRFWFEHATGAGKTVAAVGFIEASRTGGVLILTHRRNLVDQFIGEISTAATRIGSRRRCSTGQTIPTGRSRSRPTSGSCATPGRVSDAYSIVICDEAHTALGEKTSACIRNWTGPVVHRHDRDRGADRAPRRRPLPDPDLALRPRPGGAPRRDLAAALHPDPAGPGRADDRQGAAAPRRGRPGLRPGRARRAARPGALQRRRRRPLPVALRKRARASSTPPASGTPRTSPRRFATSASTPRPSRARPRSASWPRSSPASSAARSTCSATRCCSPRAGTRPARRSACTSRRPHRGASTSSASVASRAATRARKPAS